MGFRDKFYDYYQKELSYLRNSSVIFASHFPKIARRLDLSMVESSDPHVERLLESFAYLTARLQQDIDDQFPKFSAALLGVLYPQLINPLPSYTIARLFPSDDKGKLTTAYNVKKGTPLFARTKEGTVCRFQTAYGLDLMPITIDKLELVDSHDIDNMAMGSSRANRLLKITISCVTGNFVDMKMKKLRLYINGDHSLKCHIYEGLFSSDANGFIKCNSNDFYRLKSDSLQPVGFAHDESVFPYSSKAHDGYRAILEYFYFIEKFFFFDIDLSNINLNCKTCEIFLPVSNNVSLRSESLRKDSLLVNCVPIVNLFEKNSEPLLLDQRHVEYRLVADIRAEHTTEIYSIKEVIGIDQGIEKTRLFRPYFSYNHDDLEREQKAFWHMRRSETGRIDLPGTDVHLSFVDFDFNPMDPPAETIYAKVLCTNRNLAPNIPAGGILWPDDTLPVDKILCLNRPSEPVYPPQDGHSQWRMISQLSLNHLTLTGGESAVVSLKELLRLYGCFKKHKVIDELDTLKEMKTDTVVRRFGDEAWRGFAEGTRVSMTFDAKDSIEGSSFLFAMMLNHVLPMFASMTSFTQLDIYRTNFDGVWKSWKPRTGTNQVL